MPGEPLLPSIPWLARENARLIEHLRSLPDAAWSAPTFCSEWNAAQLVGHMTGGAISYAERIQAARRGEFIISLGAETPEEFQEAREAISQKSLAMPPAERVEWLAQSQDALQEEIELLEPGDLDRDLWHRKGNTKVRTFPDQRLNEVALHRWDLDNAPDAPLPTDTLNALLAILKDRLPLNLNRTGAGNLSGVFRFETHAPEAAWEMRAGGGVAAPAETLCAAPDVTLSASACDMVLLCAGRAERAAKIAEGSLRVQGNAQKAARLMDLLFRPF